MSLFVIKGLMDEHWRPIFEMCAPCSRQVEYDFIIKLENLDLEQKYFVEKIEISKNIRDSLKIGFQYLYILTQNVRECSSQSSLSCPIFNLSSKIILGKQKFRQQLHH